MLLATMKEVNSACNTLSEYAWENKVFRQYDLQRAQYYHLKESFGLTAQVVIQCIKKVVDSYKLNKNAKHQFKPFGAIRYDSRILSWKANRVLSIWTLDGRQKIKYATGKHHDDLLKYQQGESHLCHINDIFYVHTTCEVPDSDEQLIEDFLGLDLGIRNIATDSDGESYFGTALYKMRQKSLRTRASLQSKNTRGAKKVLKRISGKERTTARIVNHTISKAIVTKAKKEGKAIVLENLKGIRRTMNKRLHKVQKGINNTWSFYQLKGFIEYKARRAGVQIIVVAPAYTSKTCSSCHHIGNRVGEEFNCTNCGHSEHSDINAAKNIRSWGRVVALPEESMLTCDMPRVYSA